jgi:beta-lactam-binding protein with PASTA domain
MSYSSIEQRHGFFKKAGSVFRIFKEYVSTNTRVIIKNIVIILFVFLIVFIAVSAFVFWLIRKGPPEVTVPKVTEKELIESLIILQKKNLDVLVDPRYFSEYQKNIVVEQIPKAGSIVREGKDIKLIVSKGPIISIVEDYTGKTMAYVQNRLQEIFSFQGKTIKIGNITYVISEQPQGTIIGQYPPPNTPITNVENIDLVISKGREIQAFRLNDYTGQNVNEVMQLLALRGVLVRIVTEEVTNPAQNGLILQQEPGQDTLVSRNDTVTFHVGYLPSEKEKERLYARVLNFDVPKDLQNVAIRIVVRDRIGEREIYNADNNGGDSISIPFKSYQNTTVYIYIDDAVYEVKKLE